MTYLTAKQRPIPATGPGSDVVYRRHGFVPFLAARYRSLGVPASVARKFSSAPDLSAHLPWLAETFSVVGLRELAGRTLTAADVAVLRRLAEEDLSRVRAYVSKTRLSVNEIEWLMSREVPCEATVAWTRRLFGRHQRVNLMETLFAANMFHGVPSEDVAGWVRYANTHEVVYSDDGRSAWSFLGGDTALMAAAGLSPREAHVMTRTNRVDHAALRLLAGLRTPVRSLM